MPSEPSTRPGQVRTAEVIAALCLATDLGMGLPLEHGLHSTLVGMRLAGHLGVDAETASQVFYGCLLFYSGCTVDAEVAAEFFDDGTLLTYFTPVMLGSPSQTMVGIMRALASPATSTPVRVFRVARRLPQAVRGHQRHVIALCEVARMLSERLGVPPSISNLFAHLTERWDGRGSLARIKGDQLPLALRIVHVARDAAFQRMIGGEEYATRVIRERAGGAFDPTIAAVLADKSSDILALDDEKSAWDETLAEEPFPWLTLDHQGLDRALATMGDFADLISPYLVGHSSGVAELATAAAQGCGLRDPDVVTVRRAAFVHDLGRVAVPARIWQKAAPLTPDDWEHVRLHAYHAERVLCRSPLLAPLAPVVTAHHERLDGTGYHRGATAVSLTPAARVLAAADAYHAMTEPRPHRDALIPERAADVLRQEASTGRLDGDSVAAVLEAAGHRAQRIERPAGLTEREIQVVALLARGFQTKQIGRALGISTKTADHHVQNAYTKMGVSTRAAAAVFAMQHGLASWGELPMVRASGHS